MSLQFILILVIFIIPSLLLIWIIRLFQLYNYGARKRKSFYIQFSLLMVVLITISAIFGVLPFQKNYHIKQQTEVLTGKSFWSREEFSFEEFSIRGEGYSIDVYRYGEDVSNYFENPDQGFFDSYPKEMMHRENWIRENWKRTPITKEEQKFLNHATPHYANWSKYKSDKMKFIREIVNEKGAFYAYNFKNDSRVDFFIISPNKKLVIIINHSM